MDGRLNFSNINRLGLRRTLGRMDAGSVGTYIIRLGVEYIIIWRCAAHSLKIAKGTHVSATNVCCILVAPQVKQVSGKALPRCSNLTLPRALTGQAICLA